MSATESLVAPPAVESMRVRKERLIAAPIDIVFQTVLEPQGHLASMALKLEAWPGGRWYRDLGNNTGHLWGHVQVIKPPKLLEIAGPMMMSYAAAGHIQYRLSEEPGGTLLVLTHTAVGLILKEHSEGVVKGWAEILESINAAAVSRAGR